jgi:gluconate 2-dehydrogenase gamma chain
MDRVFPAGSGPSAGDANAMGYFDWYTRQPEFGAHAAAMSRGLALLDDVALRIAGREFVACDGDEQDAVLHLIEDTPHPTVQRFLRLLVRLTLAGVLTPPTFGGNRDRIGWRFIGYDPRPVPPRAPTHADPQLQP